MLTTFILIKVFQISSIDKNIYASSTQGNSTKIGLGVACFSQVEVKQKEVIS